MTWRKVWREKDKMTLRKKLMLSFLILVLLMGSMIGYFSYQNAKNLVLENKEQSQFSTFYCIWFSDYKKAIKTIKTKNKNYWLFLKIKKILEKRRF